MEITAVAIQEVANNQNVIFTETIIPGSPSIIHRAGSGIVKVRGACNCQDRARFKVYFNANAEIPADGTATSVISLAISLDGEPVGAATMLSTPGAVERYSNISSSVYIDIPARCCSTIGVKNISGFDVNVQNANLIVERVA